MSSYYVPHTLLGSYTTLVKMLLLWWNLYSIKKLFGIICIWINKFKNPL